MNDRSKTNKYFEITFLALFILQLIFVVYTNLFKIPDTLDNDTAKLFLHAIEIWNNKKLFLDNWVNMTTLEIDCSALFAMPLYSLTNNIYTAFGIANIIFVALYIYILYGITKKYSDDKIVFYATSFLILIPYSFGQLFYYNMMFFSGGQYVVKSIIPLMLIWLISKASDDNKIEWMIVASACSIFALILGISSGLYIFMSVLIPVCIGYFISALLEEKPIKELVFNKVSILLAVDCFLSLAGIFISLKKHVNTRGNSARLIPADEFTQSILNRIKAIFELLGGISGVSYDAISVNGIIVAARFVFALIFVIVIIATVVTVIKKLLKQEQLLGGSKISFYVVFIFLFNLFILIMTDSGGISRYQLLSFIPFFSIFVCTIKDGIEKINNKNMKSAVICVTMFIVVIVAVGSDHQVLKNECFPEMNSLVNKANQIISFVDGYEENHVFIVNDTGLPEMLRLMDYNGEGNKSYMGYIADTDSVDVYDYYYSDEHYEWLNSPCIIIICDSNTSIEDLKPDLQERCKYEGKVQNYSVYLAK